MGLFHLEYEPNLRVFVQSLRELKVETSMQMRCGSLRPGLRREADFIHVLPFAEEAEIERDLREVDLLYLPLPFDTAHASFVRFSLSTKLVTYLGSGIPIFYHGPAQSAVGELLAKNEAAFICDSLESTEVTHVLRRFINDSDAGETIARRALELARTRFSLAHIREKFWGAIGRALMP